MAEPPKGTFSDADIRTWDEKLFVRRSQRMPGYRGIWFVTPPGSDNDLRTNVYYAQTTDWGKTWTAADGKRLKLPLKKSVTEARVLDLRALGKPAPRNG